MRIVYVIERLSGTGGLQRILTEKMNYLAEHTAHEVVLMTVWHDDRALPYTISPQVRRIRLNVPPTLLALPLAISKFNRYIKRANPDVTIFFRAVGALLAGCTTWKGKKIFETHSAFQHSNHTWLYPRMMRKVDAVVCLTQGDKANYHAARRVVVIPNFTTMQCAEAAPLTLKRCIAVGRLCKEKDFGRLIRLWGIIRQERPGWTLDIYGDGEERDSLQRQVTALGLTGSVTLHGNTSDVKAEYIKSSMLLMTSRTEGMPMTIIESMTCGVPVVAFDCPYGPSDLIRDGENGYLIPYDDDKMFVSRVVSLMDDEKMRRDMGQMGRTKTKEYAPASVMSQWLKLFQQIR